MENVALITYSAVYEIVKDCMRCNMDAAHLFTHGWAGTTILVTKTQFCCFSGGKSMSKLSPFYCSPSEEFSESVCGCIFWDFIFLDHCLDR